MKQLAPKCPNCGRLTVDNVAEDRTGGHHHCKTCDIVICACTAAYDSLGNWWHKNKPRNPIQETKP